ncbi:hypothetical protein GIB67_023226, partial [Kingdonia uniflora]
GIGIINAIEVVNAFLEEDGLQKFMEWLESLDLTILGTLNGQNGANSKKRKSKVKKSDGSLNQGQDDYQLEDDIDDTRQTFMDKCNTFVCKLISKRKLRIVVDIKDVRREVEIMKHLPPYPNIVRLKDTYEDDVVVHLVMELCEGRELFDRIVVRGHYTERAAAIVTKTIVEVVQYMVCFP